MQFILIFHLLAAAGPSCLMESDFTLTTTVVDNKKTAEVVRGKLYLLEGPVVSFETTSPVNQLMRVTRDTTDIYYPKENKLFRIISKSSLPGANSSVSKVFDMDIEKQLHDAGLRVERSFKKGDTTLMRWGASNSPEAITGRIGDDLVVFRTSGKGWAVELQLRDYRKIGDKRYPHHLRSIVTKPGLKKTEELRLENSKLNTPLPARFDEDWAKYQGVEIKTVEWYPHP